MAQLGHFLHLQVVSNLGGGGGGHLAGGRQVFAPPNPSAVLVRNKKP